MPPDLVINITVTCGSRRSFQVAGPAFAREFDNSGLTVFHPAGDMAVPINNCTAALSADALHILCEDFREEVSGDHPAGLKSFPAGWPEIHKPQNQ